MAKIAVLIRSQRANGNRRILADSFIDGANEQNTVDVIVASDMRFLRVLDATVASKPMATFAF